ncbi:MAG: DUF421 domain-containing protein [Oscillospiraceae bacterium]|nr:DUF421 domain-containing protein [Oscillospiraceae bacterium]
MLITVLRVAILYLVVMAAIRLMGKRQVGELQPTELVVTILLSELVAIPIQDNSIPMATSLISAAILVGFEILNSIFAVKSNRYRVFTQGHSIQVIKDGKPDLAQLKNLRISLDDLMEALRQKDLFDISQVQSCIVETTGKISALPKPAQRGVTIKDLQLQPKDDGIPVVLVYDGQRIPERLADAGLTLPQLEAIIKKQKTPEKSIMLLTMNKSGDVFCVPKEVRG